MRYFLHLSYQGTVYSGWQKQTTAISIQQTIAEALSQILKEEIFIHGCGRTDAGVHASQYFAHFDTTQELAPDTLRILNKTLPSDIGCFEIISVDNDSHTQYHAKQRTYEYHIHLDKIPHLNEISAYYEVSDLNYELMQDAIDILVSTSDFRSLCKTPDLYKHTLCKINRINFTVDSRRIKFEITADRYLRSMIRLMIARLLEIGEGKLSLEKFSTTLASMQSFEHPHMKKAYPQGLYLSKVEYDFLTRENICKV